MSFKKRAPRAIKEIRTFAAKAMVCTFSAFIHALFMSRLAVCE